MSKHKKSIACLLLTPLLFMMALQGLLPFCALLASGTRQTMEANEVDIDSNLVRNRTVMLENAMIDQWSAIRKESASLSTALSSFLCRSGNTVKGFLYSQDLQNRYMQLVYPDLLQYVERDQSCGVFLILANMGDISQPREYVGFFLRDSDPSTKTETNSDLLFERGDKTLARQSGITLDSSWSPRFSFQGAGQRAADDFFYTPYQMALQNKTADMSSLGYWSMPFVLEDHALDNHKMITYSIPLVCNGEVYGVLGTEISTSYLENSYFPLRELDTNQNVGYVLAVDLGDGQYLSLAGKGALYDAACRDNASFTLEKARQDGLYRVKDANIGAQKIYAVQSALTLYNRHVPYPNTRWVLCGFVTGESIFGLSNRLYGSIMAGGLVYIAGGVGLMLATARRVTRPFHRLMDSVRGGVEGLETFRPTGVSEVDELHDVLQTLTKNELSTKRQLNEEKERYRIAVQSSSDIFFTYNIDNRMLEIVNSRHNDGLWTDEKHWEELLKRCVVPEDMSKVERLLAGKADTVREQIRMLLPGQTEPRWFEIRGKTVVDTQNESRRMIGFIRDIHQQRVKEMEQELKLLRDPVTRLYRLQPGMDKMDQLRQKQPEGVLAMMDFDRFRQVMQNYGLTFGDVVLQEFAAMLDEASRNVPDRVLIRAGADQFLAWLPNQTEQDCRGMIGGLQEKLSGLIRRDTLQLRAGLALAGREDATEDLVGRAQVANAAAAKARQSVVCWARLQPPLPTPKPFTPVVSQGYILQLGLVTMALNLFERSSSLEAALDLLAYLLGQRFGLENLLVTAFHEEYLVSSVEYQWRPLPGITDQTLLHCTREGAHQLTRNAEMHALQPAGDVLPMVPLLPPSQAGMVFSMSDNGRYTGSIFLAGISPDMLENDDDANLLWRIGAIVQNRINREHHDKSAQAKADFLARMSHEIRTPMNGIIGMTDIALQEGQSDARRIDCLKKVQSSSHYLLRLLNDILDMSKIESGKMTLVESAFDLKQLLDQLHVVLDAKFEEKRQRFITHVQLEHSYFMGDALRINQVLINLLGNAGKYSGPDTDITLTVTEAALPNRQADVYFAVEDQGIGIDPEDQERIFQNFEQVEHTAARQQGTGLGLPISDRLVHLMGSSISLCSQPGKGSRFSFTLRLSLADAPSQTLPLPAFRQNFAGIHVMVAEDNALNMEILSAFLEEMGCTVDCVHNGAQAVKRFRQAPIGAYQIIFMDVMMPVMTGLEATHAIRQMKRPDSGSVVIVAVSANAFDEDIQRSLASGMNAHLSKPVEPEQLALLMSRMLPQGSYETVERKRT